MKIVLERTSGRGQAKANFFFEYCSGVQEQKKTGPKILSNSGNGLRQNIVHHSPMDIGETKLASLIAVGQSFVIKAKAVQNCRLQIINMNRVLNHVESEVICAAIDYARFDPAA